MGPGEILIAFATLFPTHSGHAHGARARGCLEVAGSKRLSGSRCAPRPISMAAVDKHRRMLGCHRPGHQARATLVRRRGFMKDRSTPANRGCFPNPWPCGTDGMVCDSRAAVPLREASTTPLKRLSSWTAPNRGLTGVETRRRRQTKHPRILQAEQAATRCRSGKPFRATLIATARCRQGSGIEPGL